MYSVLAVTLTCTLYFLIKNIAYTIYSSVVDNNLQKSFPLINVTISEKTRPLSHFFKIELDIPTDSPGD